MRVPGDQRPPYAARVGFATSGSLDPPGVSFGECTDAVLAGSLSRSSSHVPSCFRLRSRMGETAHTSVVGGTSAEAGEYPWQMR